MDFGFSYVFPAVRGKQALKEYYVVMCPLKLIPKIFLFDEEEIPAEHRSQRILNKNRIPEITNYIIENSKDYVFSSLTASVDGEMQFNSINADGGFKDIGQLHVSLDARFLINDGQHRRAAIEEALKIDPELGNETISIVIFQDTGLKKSQQIFSDLNRHAVNTTTSIGILYDHRDKLSILTKEIVANNTLLARYTDKERVTLSKNSPKILALNHIFNTNLRLVNKSKGENLLNEEEQFLIDFWNELTQTLQEWNLVFEKKMSARDLRMNYINGHGVCLEAIGLVGYFLIKNYSNDWKGYIHQLNSIDWSRTNEKDWLHRAISPNGRIQKTRDTILLTANKIKQLLNLPLTEVEQKIEEKYGLGDFNDVKLI
ncbi:DNA sulfur modification protein DndB [Bacillus sp. AL-1R]